MRFFFYGTLIAGSDNPVARMVHARLRDLGPGTVRGALHAIREGGGWYPALVPGSGRVTGRLYAALPDFAPGDLVALDRWEDYDPASPADSLYQRESMWIAPATGAPIKADVYRFARPLPDDSRPIPTGDFPAWLAQTGFRAFGG